MKIKELMQILDDCCNDVIFEYKEKAAGITATVENYIPTYQVWYGEKTKEYNNLIDAVYDPIFDGKSLFELIEIVDIDVL